jgi:phosphoenolpyruvate-protein kinase (PTS system EI component)
MSDRELRGLAASGGIALGRAWIEHDPEEAGSGDGDPLAALDELAEELERAADRLRADGLPDEAEILEANRLMAEDPTLRAEVTRLAKDEPAGHALVEATGRHADLLAGLADPMLAARSADVRELGRRAARLVVGAVTAQPHESSILVARDLGPVDVAELRLGDGGVEGIALADGAATSHAAIMARALGVPMAVGLGDELLSVARGTTVIVDGDQGSVAVAPSPVEIASARRHLRARRRASAALAADRELPAETTDGRRIELLCNASTAAEVSAGLEAGAEGVGLLRTELAFLEWHAWPTEEEHAAALGPALDLLRGRTATVRTLDFGADKTPPFLAGIEERGLTLTLAHATALSAQVRAIARAGAATRLRVLLPLVESGDQVRAVRGLAPGVTLGAMIETPTAVEAVAEIAVASDFLSIGTNDLVQYTLRLDRDRPLASALTASEPEILRLVAHVVDTAHAVGRTVEICGEAAGEAALAALFVGLGVDELSVAPARLDRTRATVRSLTAAAAAEAARSALECRSATEVLELAEELLSGQARDEAGQVVGGLGGVVP